MPSLRINRRSYVVTAFYEQHQHPCECGSHILEVVTTVPTKCIEETICYWRESEVNERLYPEDFNLIVIVDVDTKVMWVYYRSGIYSRMRWKKIFGPTFTRWRDQYKLR